jgi:hypothetical protein
MGYRADLDAAVGRVDRLRREVERTNDDLSKEIRAWAGDGDKAMARRWDGQDRTAAEPSETAGGREEWERRIQSGGFGPAKSEFWTHIFPIFSVKSTEFN